MGSFAEDKHLSLKPHFLLQPNLLTMTGKKLILLFVCSLIWAGSLSAQALDHALGQLLIRVEPEADLRAFTEDMRRFRGEETNFRMLRKVSDHMNIWLASFDYAQINENEFLAHLQKQRMVDAAQFNHFTKLRSTTPNDPDFILQWQYINDGSNGGVVGADIDADLAWDITTGGLTANGDTIVVCIVDGGYDLAHEDWGDNLWINHAEIPDNGMDDDNNGFIDDYYGWNTGTQNDDVSGSPFHGTSVAGIVGAQGDNGIGVAGVNWNVKLMLVVGGTGVESEVIEAYSYALNNRKKYNETAGAEGAFVVATNSSWGVDFGQPSDAPLWCAFYDTLGVHGILSAGATINDNQNVDVVGDLPTACPSDYLITVTNMDNTDNKVSFAGYGATTIDLGAFGQNTWTMAYDGYGPFGGTSGATPHVAGAIALLYSAPCPTLASLALSNPQLAAEMVRDYILEGVDPNSSLDGITTTGGRLNIFNSLQLVVENCGPCPLPFSVQFTDVTDVEATMTFEVTDSVTAVDFRWREAGAMTWDTVVGAPDTFAFTGLTACTEYEVQFLVYCSDTTNGYSDAYYFMTDGCCEPPAGLHLTVLDTATTQFAWSPLLAAASYYLLFTLEDGNTILVDNISDTTALGPGFMPCVTVQVQIGAVCTSGDTTALSEPLIFLTPGCGACMDLSYCLPQASTGFEYIQNVALEGIANNSGDNGGYFFFDNMSTTLMTFNTYSMTLEPGFTGSTYGEVFVVWIDFNQDGDFEDAGEEVFVSEPTQTAITFDLFIPGDVQEGITRMRVGMGYDGGPLPTPCATNIEGEYEDYCVSIVPGVPPPCNAPENVMVSNIGFFSATVSWELPTPADAFTVEYKEVSAMDWITVSGIQNIEYIISNLNACSEYVVRLRSECSDSTSSYSEEVTFMTECLPDCSEVPAALTVSDTTEVSALISWGATPNAVSYTLQWRPAGAADWTDVVTMDTSYMLAALDTCTNYELRVRADCELNISSAYTDEVSFSTLCLSTGLFSPAAPSLKAEVSPNPFADFLLLSLGLERASQVEVLLYDATGRMVYERKEQLPFGKSEMLLQLPAELSSGIYLLEVRTEQGHAVVRLVK